MVYQLFVKFVDRKNDRFYSFYEEEKPIIAIATFSFYSEVKRIKKYFNSINLASK